MSELEPIEPHLGSAEVLDPTATLVIGGWPLIVEGLLRNADATRRRYSLAGEPLVAISAEVTMPGWDVERFSRDVSRLRTRRIYASTLADATIAAYSTNPHHQTGRRR